CDELRPDLDWILIDSPAGIERGFRNSIAAADKVLIVTNPEMSAVRDADRVMGLLEAEEKASPSLIINRLNPNMVRRGDMLSVDDVYDLLRVDVIGIVPEDENIIVASNKGTPLSLEGKTKAGQAFRNIARRLNGEEVPFMDLESHGLWDRLSKLTGRK
ncbi:MAG: septum site-determining protein MinD, partial [Chloroflexi bacterium]|nr:septum site-determining protein MinD [Chloroflexota bacterium]